MTDGGAPMRTQIKSASDLKRYLEKQYGPMSTWSYQTRNEYRKLEREIRKLQDAMKRLRSFRIRL